MADKFSLDADGVSEVCQELDGAGDRLDTALHSLSSVLDAHDGCWGHDDIGKAFDGQYVTPAKDAQSGASDAVDGVKNVSEDLGQASSDFQNIDEGNASQV